MLKLLKKRILLMQYFILLYIGMLLFIKFKWILLV